MVPTKNRKHASAGRFLTFPDVTREGTAAHKSARDRLDAARDERNRRRATYDAAQGETSQRDALGNLAEANEQLAAREAWVSWIERGY
jgi:hypothetical protein